MSERRYGQWAGNPKGRAEDPSRCIKEIYLNNRGGSANQYQCLRKRGHGPEGLYCKQHDPVARQARQEEEWAKRSRRLKMEREERNQRAQDELVGSRLRRCDADAYARFLSEVQ